MCKALITKYFLVLKQFVTMRLTRRIAALAGVIMIAGAVVGCKKDSKMETVETIKISSHAVHGNILTDKDGKALYFFSRDYKDGSECNDDCLDNWPIFYMDVMTEVGAGLNAADFATLVRSDGSKQTTYKGWPLYYYAKDAAAGEVKGDKSNNVWFVAKPDYSLMYVSAQLVGNDGKNYTSSYMEGTGPTSYIVDFSGRTLYAFVNDRKDKNNFTQADFSNNNTWPIFDITIDMLPSILNKADFNTIDVHGRKQLTYKGWPLYYFGADAKRGDNKGGSVPRPGVWPVVNINTNAAPEA